MEKEPTKHHSIAIKRSLRSILAISTIYLSTSCAPSSPPPPMPDNQPVIASSMAAFGTINFPPSSEIETPTLEVEIPTLSGPGPDPEIKAELELKVEDDPNILDVPGVGKFRKTNVVVEGEASTYSVDGCLGCRLDRIMKNGKELKDEDNTMAVPPEGLVSVGNYVLVENITEPAENDPPETPSVVAEVTDTGGFKEEYNRVADLTLTTNHNIKGGVRGGGLRSLQVRLTLLEVIELTASNS